MLNTDFILTKIFKFTKRLEVNAFSGANFPILFKVTDAEKDSFYSIIKKQYITLVDTIDEQLFEWSHIKNPKIQSKKFHTVNINKELENSHETEFSVGNWIYYPWRKTIVHVLPKDKFYLVKENRNRDKITHKEQSLLRKKRIGVIGLSVGHMSALAIAQEGICGTLKLADYDILNLSNLNRLRSSLINLGQQKTQIAQREIAELDPFINTIVYPNGITDASIKEFCISEKKLDLIVEECDDLYVKFRIREFAKKWKIPVVMETNDRGMIDIERFDLEPQRNLFHGLTEGYTSEDVKNLSPAKRLTMICKILGGEKRMSYRMQLSVKKIGSELINLPQLSSETHLGGALVAHTARKILLNTFLSSGRFSIDLNEAISDREDRC